MTVMQLEIAYACFSSAAFRLHAGRDVDLVSGLLSFYSDPTRLESVNEGSL
jgi:hypothetical protein